MIEKEQVRRLPYLVLLKIADKGRLIFEYLLQQRPDFEIFLFKHAHILVKYHEKYYLCPTPPVDSLEDWLSIPSHGSQLYIPLQFWFSSGPCYGQQVNLNIGTRGDLVNKQYLTFKAPSLKMKTEAITSNLLKRERKKVRRQQRLNNRWKQKSDWRNRNKCR